MTIKLGTHPIAWTNDDMPELGGDTPLETCLEEAREAGFVGVEKGGKFPNEPEALKAVLGRYGLELTSSWYSGELRRRSVEDEIKAMRPLRARPVHVRAVRTSRAAASSDAEKIAGRIVEYGTPVEEANWSML